MSPARLMVFLAMVAGFVLVAAALFGGDGGHSYKLLFQSGGQLVRGNEVLVAGQPIGKVDELSLTDDGQAVVEITVDEPLHEGTTAVIRSTSLSGIANRYVSVAPGLDSAPEIEDGGMLTPEETTTPVDLDELFAALDAKTRKSLQDVIEGSATLYGGNTAGARASYKYLAPSLQSTQRLLAELTRDQRTFGEFLTSGASVLGAIAERRDDLSALTQNANEALGAIAAENESLDRSLTALPPAMRQANTTFVNLRAALDDLDSLVETSKPATEDLAPFLRDLRPVASRAVPVVRNLRQAVATPGGDNDLTDVLRVAPRVQDLASTTSDTGIAAINATDENIAFARAYSPDLMSAFAKLGQVTAYYDGNGHYARVLPAGLGAFTYNSANEELVPAWQQPALQFNFFSSTTDALEPDGFERCPGAASQEAEDGSTPFLEGVGGNCDPDGDFVLPGATP